MDGKQPPEPLTQLAQGAAGLHECFMAYVQAGFTAEQAMQLVSTMLQTILRNEMP